MKQYEMIPLLKKFIGDTRTGRRLQKNGKRVRINSLRNYQFLLNALESFCHKKEFVLRISPSLKLNKREYIRERNYWKKFYKRFTDYLYDDCGYFDNYVGMHIKLLRTFLNHVDAEYGWNISSFYKNFYVRTEEIPVIVLSPERLNYLIHNCEKEVQLSQRLQKVKDIFVFGCTVALRSSDLLNLTKHNLEQVNDSYYLKVRSSKTETFTRVKLPEYAIAIVKRYSRSRRKTLLPGIHNATLNKYIKELFEKLNWIETALKTRQQRGIQIPIYKNAITKEHYRFCDLVSIHTMRRTAITTMLSLGLGEQLVRRISGHAPNSKEFYKYVAYAQSYLDKETDQIFEKLTEKKLLVAV